MAAAIEPEMDSPFKSVYSETLADVETLISVLSQRSDLATGLREEILQLAFASERMQTLAEDVTAAAKIMRSKQNNPTLVENMEMGLRETEVKIERLAEISAQVGGSLNYLCDVEKDVVANDVGQKILEELVVVKKALQKGILKPDDDKFRLQFQSAKDSARPLADEFLSNCAGKQEEIFRLRETSRNILAEVALLEHRVEIMLQSYRDSLGLDGDTAASIKQELKSELRRALTNARFNEEWLRAVLTNREGPREVKATSSLKKAAVACRQLQQVRIQTAEVVSTSWCHGEESFEDLRRYVTEGSIVETRLQELIRASSGGLGASEVDRRRNQSSFDTFESENVLEHRGVLSAVESMGQVSRASRISPHRSISMITPDGIAAIKAECDHVTSEIYLMEGRMKEDGRTPSIERGHGQEHPREILEATFLRERLDSATNMIDNIVTKTQSDGTTTTTSSEYIASRAFLTTMRDELEQAKERLFAACPDANTVSDAPDRMSRTRTSTHGDFVDELINILHTNTGESSDMVEEPSVIEVGREYVSVDRYTKDISAVHTSAVPSTTNATDFLKDAKELADRLENESRKRQKEQEDAWINAQAEIARLTDEVQRARVKSSENEAARRKLENEIIVRRESATEKAERMRHELSDANRKAGTEEAARIKARQELANVRSIEAAKRKHVENEAATLMAEVDIARKRADLHEADRLNTEVHLGEKVRELSMDKMWYSVELARYKAEDATIKQTAEREVTRFSTEAEEARERLEKEIEAKEFAFKEITRLQAEEIRSRKQSDDVVATIAADYQAASDIASQELSKLAAQIDAAKHQLEQEKAFRKEAITDKDVATADAHAAERRRIEHEAEVRRVADEEILLLRLQQKQALDLAKEEVQRKGEEAQLAQCKAEANIRSLTSKIEKVRREASAEESMRKIALEKANKNVTIAESKRAAAENTIESMKAEIEDLQLEATSSLARLQAELVISEAKSSEAKILSSEELASKSAEFESILLNSNAENVRLQRELELQSRMAQEEWSIKQSELEIARNRSRAEMAELRSEVEAARGREKEARERIRADVTRMENAAAVARELAAMEAMSKLAESDVMRKRAENDVIRIQQELENVQATSQAQIATLEDDLTTAVKRAESEERVRISLGHDMLTQLEQVKLSKKALEEEASCEAKLARRSHAAAVDRVRLLEGELHDAKLRAEREELGQKNAEQEAARKAELAQKSLDAAEKESIKATKLSAQLQVAEKERDTLAQEMETVKAEARAEIKMFQAQIEAVERNLQEENILKNQYEENLAINKSEVQRIVAKTEEESSRRQLEIFETRRHSASVLAQKQNAMDESYKESQAKIVELKNSLELARRNEEEMKLSAEMEVARIGNLAEIAGSEVEEEMARTRVYLEEAKKRAEEDIAAVLEKASAAQNISDKRLANLEADAENARKTEFETQKLFQEQIETAHAELRSERSRNHLANENVAMQLDAARRTAELERISKEKEVEHARTILQTDIQVLETELAKVRERFEAEENARRKAEFEAKELSSQAQIASMNLNAALGQLQSDLAAANRQAESEKNARIAAEQTAMNHASKADKIRLETEVAVAAQKQITEQRISDIEGQLEKARERFLEEETRRCSAEVNAIQRAAEAEEALRKADSKLSSETELHTKIKLAEGELERFRADAEMAQAKAVAELAGLQADLAAERRRASEAEASRKRIQEEIDLKIAQAEADRKFASEENARKIAELESAHKIADAELAKRVIEAESMQNKAFSDIAALQAQIENAKRIAVSQAATKKDIENANLQRKLILYERQTEALTTDAAELREEVVGIRAKQGITASLVKEESAKRFEEIAAVRRRAEQEIAEMQAKLDAERNSATVHAARKQAEIVLARTGAETALHALNSEVEVLRLKDNKTRMAMETKIANLEFQVNAAKLNAKSAIESLVNEISETRKREGLARRSAEYEVAKKNNELEVVCKEAARLISEAEFARSNALAEMGNLHTKIKAAQKKSQSDEAGRILAEEESRKTKMDAEHMRAAAATQVSSFELQMKHAKQKLQDEEAARKRAEGKADATRAEAHLAHQTFDSYISSLVRDMTKTQNRAEAEESARKLAEIEAQRLEIEIEAAEKLLDTRVATLVAEVETTKKLVQEERWAKVEAQKQAVAVKAEANASQMLTQTRLNALQSKVDAAFVKASEKDLEKQRADGEAARLRVEVVNAKQMADNRVATLLSEVEANREHARAEEAARKFAEAEARRRAKEVEDAYATVDAKMANMRLEMEDTTDVKKLNRELAQLRTEIAESKKKADDEEELRKKIQDDAGKLIWDAEVARKLAEQELRKRRRESTKAKENLVALRAQLRVLVSKADKAKMSQNPIAEDASAKDLSKTIAHMRTIVEQAVQKADKEEEARKLAEEYAARSAAEADFTRRAILEKMNEQNRTSQVNHQQVEAKMNKLEADVSEITQKIPENRSAPMSENNNQPTIRKGQLRLGETFTFSGDTHCKCGARLAENAENCIACGRVRKARCGCGRTFKGNSKFCFTCGNPRRPHSASGSGESQRRGAIKRRWVKGRNASLDAAQFPEAICEDIVQIKFDDGEATNRKIQLYTDHLKYFTVDSDARNLSNVEGEVSFKSILGMVVWDAGGYALGPKDDRQRASCDMELKNGGRIELKTLSNVKGRVTFDVFAKLFQDQYSKHPFAHQYFA